MNLFGLCGALSAFIAVGAGAFGAHGLRNTLTPELLHTFETGARYQMYHALGLALIAVLPKTSLTTSAGWMFLAGTVLFSGSLYALCLSGVTWLGAITPLGGLCFLAGWATLAVQFARR